MCGIHNDDGCNMYNRRQHVFSSGVSLPPPSAFVITFTTFTRRKKRFESFVPNCPGGHAPYCRKFCQAAMPPTVAMTYQQLSKARSATSAGTDSMSAIRLQVNTLLAS
ncbi:hypothetical protein VaNZ11_001843 [Volvox africanus]|uniref:Uncharacterized protein n=1 Tax=Volvox africanus TaxID=51714 RepID=A0ABQ5RQP2_9CHLO|nr:hypothetical protein VaNZ11_001843 [Volvox africanus]